MYTGDILRRVGERFAAAIVATLLSLPLSRAAAEDAEQTPKAPSAETDEPSPATGEAAPTQTEERTTSFALVPGPFYNPNIGLGVNIIPMLMFYPDKHDSVSPPSMLMLNLLYAAKPPFEASRQSAFISAATRLFLDEDRWRLVAMAAYINLFQEFYGVGGDADYSEAQFDYRLEQVVAIFQVYRQVFWKGFYLGVLVGLVAFHTKTDDPEDEATLDQLGSGAAWRAQPNLGLLSQYDTRDSKYYPTRGVNFNLRLNGSFNDGEEYLLLAPNFNQYFPLLDQDRLVLAYRVFGQFGFGNLPLSAYAHYGMRGTTLGYETGEYLDKKMAGVEVELRWLPWKRFGFEAGGGVGKVFAEFADFFDEAWLPGVWGSANYKIMAKHDMRARMTLAYGKSGVMFYFTIGQNF